MRVLKFSSFGPAVQLLQLALVRAGFGPLDTDGIFGRATASALRRFQRSVGLEADGVAGALTQRRLIPWYTGYLNHTVVSGDTLSSIAAMHNSSLDGIFTANPGIDPLRLQTGDSVIVPLPFPVVPTDIAYSSTLIGYCVRGLAARYPFISTGEIGKSLMGRPLWRLTLGQGSNLVLYNGAHHANEWICTPLLLKFIEDLSAAYVSQSSVFGQSAAEIFSYATLNIIPAVNPDGIDLVTGELSSGSFYNTAVSISSRYPNIPFPSGWKANIGGVDLNLQYPAGWQQAREIKFAQGFRSPAPADFVGSAPLSAPESRAMYDYTLALSPSLILAYHTQGEVIYWRYLNYDPPASREIGQTFSNVSGYSLEDTPYASGFAGYKDWFIESFNRPGYTVEAGLGVNPLPITDFSGIYRRNIGILTYGALLT